MSTVEEISCDLETPVSLFARWKDEPYAFLLESAEGGETWGRYSFIGLDPLLIFLSRGREVEILRGSKREKKLTDDPLAELRKILKSTEPVPTGRFSGGLVGYISYDAVRFFEKIPSRARDDLSIPELCFVQPGLLLVLDNLKHSLQVISFGKRQRVGEVMRSLKRKEFLPPPARTPRKLAWQASLTQDQFKKRVGQIKDYIQAGDVTQTVLSLRFSAKTQAPFQIYRLLRQTNPSPYLYYLQLGKTAVVGASPETMVRLEQGAMTLRPIAGTRRRGRNPREDLQLEKELLADPKERAEHIMLVDLGRNDLGRVAKPGTVQVDQLMKVEKYSHVMHLVSNVRAKLARGRDAFDLLRAAFPAGTLTGSPKVRAMEIIEELEPVRRAVYGGSVGYFSSNGNMDMAITIRSALFYKGRVHVQAGAGIVADSDPAREYEECLNKARAMMVAIEGC